MKWTHVGWLLAGLLTASASLRAADVTLTVNGKVVARPCTVSTVNATVELGDLYLLRVTNVSGVSSENQAVNSFSLQSRRLCGLLTISVPFSSARSRM